MICALSSRAEKAVLPHHAKWIDESEPGAYHYLLDEIENHILAELRKILEGKDADQAAAVRAKEIMDTVKQVEEKRAEEVVAEIKSSGTELIFRAISEGKRIQHRPDISPVALLSVELIAARHGDLSPGSSWQHAIVTLATVGATDGVENKTAPGCASSA
jgi:hypothetical protein